MLHCERLVSPRWAQDLPSAIVYNGIAIKNGLIPGHYCVHEIEGDPVISRMYTRNKSKVSPWILFIIALVPPWYLETFRQLLGIAAPTNSFPVSAQNGHRYLFVPDLSSESSPVTATIRWRPALARLILETSRGSNSLTRNA